MTTSKGPPGGKGNQPTERRPGKGSPWAHAKSKAASARAAASGGRSNGSRSASSSRDDAGRGRGAEPKPTPVGGRPAATKSGRRTPGFPVASSSASRPSSSSSQRAPREQWTDVDGETLEAVGYPPVDPSLPTVKLQKFLADAGLGSRRELERWIAAGRVMVNGSQATLGDRVTGTERIDVDGKALGARARSTGSHARVLMLNKPEGVICTRRDPEGRKTVFADVPTLRGGRWITVGRLDIATTGLLLLTNDGELANRMMHPSTGLDREYAVRTDVVLEDDQIATLKKGVESDGDMLRFADIRYFDGRGANHWYHVVLLEGKNHEVRRLFASVGAEVRRLKRVRYGPVLLPSWLRRGQRFELNNRDVAALYNTLGMEVDLPEERPGRRNDRRGMSDRSVLIPYPTLPGLVAEEVPKKSTPRVGRNAGRAAGRSRTEKPEKGAKYAKASGDRASAGRRSAKVDAQRPDKTDAKASVWGAKKGAPVRSAQQDTLTESAQADKAQSHSPQKNSPQKNSPQKNSPKKNSPKKKAAKYSAKGSAKSASKSGAKAGSKGASASGQKKDWRKR